MALATIAQGLARHPDDPRLLERQADIYATQPVMWPRAADLYRRLLVQRPGDLALKNKLANLSLALRQIDQAEKLFQEVLAADPDNPEAHLGLARLYLKSAFFTLAREHFAQAHARLPENREALSGLEQARGLVTPQIHTLTSFFEDSEGFRRFSLWTGFRAYVNQRIRLYGGYGYLTYNSGPVPFRGNQAGQSLHRHVLPLILQYRPVRTVLAELGVAGNDYGRWGQSVTTRSRGLLASYRRDRPLSVLTAITTSLITLVPSVVLGVYILTILRDTDATATKWSIPSVCGPRVISEPSSPIPWR